MSDDGKVGFRSYRNQFRRPSALGVPRGEFKDKSEYDKNYKEYEAERSNPYYQKDNLKYDGLDFGKGSELRDQYQDYQAPKPQRITKYNDNLTYEGQVETVTGYKNDYNEKKVERPKQSRPNDYLGPTGDQDFSTDKNMAFRRHSVSKPSKGRGVDDNLALSGNRETDTDYKREYGEKRGERSRAARPNDYLGPEGDQDFSTDKNMAYRRHSVSKPSKGRGVDDNLALSGNRETDTDYKREYGEKQGERSKASRPNDYLGPEGDQDFNTDKNIAYRRHSISKPYKGRGAEDNLGLSGDRETDTDYKREYGEKHGERSQASKPQDFLRPEGDRDFDTDQKLAYRGHSVSRPTKGKAQGDSLGLEGDLQNDTENKREYGKKRGERSKLTRPSDYLETVGDQDFNTDKNMAYRRHSVSKPSKNRGKNDTLGLEGDLQSDTDYRSEYGEKKGERVRGTRPVDYLEQQGDQDFITDKGIAYKNHDVSKPDRYRGKEDNLFPEGVMNDETDYRREYGEKYGDKPKAYRPEDFLALDGERNFQTDNNIVYQKHQASRPERYRAKGDNLVLEGNLEDETAYRNQFQGRGGERGILQRPGDVLGPDGEQEFYTDKQMAYQRHAVERPNKQKGRNATLAMEGDFERETDYQLEYSEKHGEKLKGHRPDDYLGPYGEQSFDTDKGIAYQKHEVSKPERYSRKGDHLIMEGDLDDRTAYKQDYQEKYGDRHKPYRPEVNLALEGDREFDTDKNIAYTRHGVGKPSKYKAKGDSLALAGDLEKESYYRQEFGEKKGQRLALTRPHDILGPEGSQDFETHISRAYQVHDVKRPERMKGHHEGLSKNEGSMDSSTKYAEDFQGTLSDRTKPIRAAHNLKPMNAPLEGTSEYDGRFLPHEQDITERAQARRPKSQLVTNSQEFEKDSETKRQFSLVQGRDDLLKRGREEQVRARRANATDNLRQNEGRLEGVSETQSKYDVKQHDNQMSKGTRKDNLTLNKAKMEDLTEAKSSFEPKYGRRSGVRKGPQPDNLKSNQDPFEGTSDTKASYGITSVSRTKPIKPRTSLQRNEGKFAEGSITKYSYDYRSGFPTKKPQKVRVGSQLRPRGGIEGQTEYADEYLKTNGERADWMAVNDLLTPFGHHSHETRHLGQVEHAL
ncbi:uncharacterized protein LOC131880243 [Tigriopus californicus]|uniref:uncharacterized protein LOC131880243 n=1 Tax=Tigriopus californicus TaxID=6832 RepID=UPI0027D9D828|nr:uncharacterized protein LOC131880243 [Tigriopus californicus]